MKIQSIILVSALALSACTPTLVSKLPYYKLPVVQGTQLDPEAVLSLHVGMTREQVALFIGKPLLRTGFNNSQWDYNYEVSRGGKIKEQRDLTVYFSGDKVSRISGTAIDYAKEQLQQKANPTANQGAK